MRCKNLSHRKCYGLTESDENFYCFKCRVQRKDPFHLIEEEVFKPRLLVKDQEHKFEFSFKLTKQRLDLIKAKKASIMLYLIKLSKNYQNITWASENISIFVNDQVLVYHMNSGALIPFEKLKEVTLANHIELDTPFFDSDAVFGVFYATKVPWVTIAKEALQHSMYPGYYKAIIIKELETAEVTQSTYSLICPIT